MTYGKTHLAITKQTWSGKVLSHEFHHSERNPKDNAQPLQVVSIPTTWRNFKERIGKISTDKGINWAELPVYQQEAMLPILAHPETRLLSLQKEGSEIGYSLIVPATPALKNRFWAATNHQPPSVIEIENLALYEGQRGAGVGKLFFEMIFENLFQRYDTVYWGTSDFNADTLVKFYTDKMFMTKLAYDPPKEPQQSPKVA